MYKFGFAPRIKGPKETINLVSDGLIFLSWYFPRFILLRDYKQSHKKHKTLLGMIPSFLTQY